MSIFIHQHYRLTERSDIVGGALLSAGLVLMYRAIINLKVR